MDKEQLYFERRIVADWRNDGDDTKFKQLLKDGWKIVLAIPILNEGYTVEVHYVLEK